jgi:cytoskeletal protein RodZ
MESIGHYLQREREFRKISLGEVADSTRISLACLQMIEKDQFDALPGSTFVRGYIKSYARHVGLNEQDVILRYEGWLTESIGDQARRGGLPAKKKWEWQWKYLWMTLLTASVIALAAFLSSR